MQTKLHNGLFVIFGKRSAGHVLAFKVKHGIPIGITQNIHRLTVACALGGQSGLCLLYTSDAADE